jgi:hypothetical protein
MRKVLASLALGCAFAVALSVAASACDYQHGNMASTGDSAAQTAQTQQAQQPTPSDN